MVDQKLSVCTLCKVLVNIMLRWLLWMCLCVWSTRVCAGEQFHGENHSIDWRTEACSMFNALFLYWHYPALNIKVSSLKAKCKYDRQKETGSSALGVVGHWPLLPMGEWCGCCCGEGYTSAVREVSTLWPSQMNRPIYTALFKARDITQALRTTFLIKTDSLLIALRLCRFWERCSAWI